MRAATSALWGAVIFASRAFASDAVPDASVAPRVSATPWSTTFSTEARYFSWHSSFVPSAAGDGSGAPGRGWQFYAPFAAQLTGKPAEAISLEFIARGGWVKSVQSTPGHSGSVQTTTDTVSSGTVTYLGLPGMQPFASLSANLPTGKAALFGSSANARMDPDLVDISIFGEGYNIGPTAGFNFPITGSLMVTTSVGYTWRGPFNQDAPTDPTAPFLTSKVDPGDDLTATALVNYQAGSFSAGATGTVTWETPTSANAIRTFKAGNRYLASLQSSYSWPAQLGSTSLSASYVHSNRNKVLLPGFDSLVAEFFDSNSDVYRISLQHMFPAGAFQLGPTVSALYRNHNGYSADTLQFVPSKTRWSTGLLAQFAPSQSATFNARVERVWIHEGDNPAVNSEKLDALAGGILPAATVPAISGNGWQASIGINFKL